MVENNKCYLVLNIRIFEAGILNFVFTFHFYMCDLNLRLNIFMHFAFLLSSLLFRLS
jgi:hypothetical protein